VQVIEWLRDRQLARPAQPAGVRDTALMPVPQTSLARLNLPAFVTLL
jgi:hypothetical protein